MTFAKLIIKRTLRTPFLYSGEVEQKCLSTKTFICRLSASSFKPAFSLTSGKKKKKTKSNHTLERSIWMSAAAYSGASSSCLACVFLLFATCSPWTMYSPYLMYSGFWTSFGVGPFVAGASTSSFTSGPAQFYGGVVWWSDLSSQNACANTSALYLKWAQPSGLCSPEGAFVIPPSIQGIQACIVLATLFSFLACSSGCSMSKNKQAGGGAFCFAFLALLCSISAFSLWTTWDMSLALQNPAGFYVPLYSSSNLGVTISIQPSPNRVSMYYGWTFITTILSAILLLSAMGSFAAAAKQMRDDDGAFGSGI